VPVDKIGEFEDIFLTSLATRFPNVLDNFRAGKLLDEDTDVLEKLAGELTASY
jgi:F-type H+-transporting ATPase subunit alpha